MARFPLYIDIEDKKTLIIGGGRVALRKAEILADFGADICVISPKICDGLKLMDNRGRLCCEQKTLNFGEFDRLNSAFMVVCATDDRQLNHEIACYCRKQHIWVNCSDSEADSSFLFPSVVRRNQIIIGISSSGGVPALTRHLRQIIERAVPEWYGDLEQSLRARRDVLKRSNLNHEQKREKLQQMIEDEERRRSEW
ncbi:MAG: bifunctional precorrin-2 dehydrogenase/sirohydrochlorin ferrochelatase [Coprococcus sp.]